MVCRQPIFEFQINQTIKSMFYPFIGKYLIKRTFGMGLLPAIPHKILAVEAVFLSLAKKRINAEIIRPQPQ
jgi:hypothetical protein